jgi:hypothetical protein
MRRDKAARAKRKNVDVMVTWRTVIGTHLKVGEARRVPRVPRPRPRPRNGNERIVRAFAIVL